MRRKRPWMARHGTSARARAGTKRSPGVPSNKKTKSRFGLAQTKARGTRDGRTCEGAAPATGQQHKGAWPLRRRAAAPRERFAQPSRCRGGGAGCPLRGAGKAGTPLDAHTDGGVKANRRRSRELRCWHERNDGRGDNAKRAHPCDDWFSERSATGNRSTGAPRSRRSLAAPPPPTARRTKDPLHAVGEPQSKSKNSSTVRRVCFSMWESVERLTDRCAGTVILSTSSTSLFCNRT